MIAGSGGGGAECDQTKPAENVVPEFLTILRTEVLAKRYGTIRLELWPEGLVLWVGGEIQWKEWEAK